MCQPHSTVLRFQSTFPRGERPKADKAPADQEQVSIHVPTRGTTDFDRCHMELENQFQSTFPRGERPCVVAVITSAFSCFNPRSHEGNDRFSDPFRAVLLVSIHVPTRGTTLLIPDSSVQYRSFQSTFPRGERQWSGEKGTLIRMFQSTFPRGERPKGSPLTAYFVSFNPRSHEGNDSNYL